MDEIRQCIEGELQSKSMLIPEIINIIWNYVEIENSYYITCDSLVQHQNDNDENKDFESDYEYGKDERGRKVKRRKMVHGRMIDYHDDDKKIIDLTDQNNTIHNDDNLVVKCKIRRWNQLENKFDCISDLLLNNQINKTRKIISCGDILFLFHIYSDNLTVCTINLRNNQMDKQDISDNSMSYWRTISKGHACQISDKKNPDKKKWVICAILPEKLYELENEQEQAKEINQIEFLMYDIEEDAFDVYKENFLGSHLSLSTSEDNFFYFTLDHFNGKHDFFRFDVDLCKLEIVGKFSNVSGYEQAEFVVYNQQMILVGGSSYGNERKQELERKRENLVKSIEIEMSKQVKKQQVIDKINKTLEQVDLEIKTETHNSGRRCIISNVIPKNITKSNNYNLCWYKLPLLIESKIDTYTRVGVFKTWSKNFLLIMSGFDSPTEMLFLDNLNSQNQWIHFDPNSSSTF